MFAKIKQLFSALRLYKEVEAADPNAEKAGAMRFGKALAIGLVALFIQMLLQQMGPDCMLGEATCKVLRDPQVSVYVMAAILGLEKWLNAKYGLGLKMLDSAKK